MYFRGFYGNFTKWVQTSTRVAAGAILKEWPSTIMQVKTAATVTPNTNNVFKDSSGNNFTVTRVGATAQGAFTPAAITTNTNADVLLLFNNAAVYDTSRSCNIETVGTTTISTARTKTGTTSMYFNGQPGCARVLSARPPLGRISGDFTIDMWINWAAIPPSNPHAHIIGQSIYPEESTVDDSWSLRAYTNQLLFTVEQYGTVSVNTTWEVDRWYHIAVTRQDSVVRLFIDGKLMASGVVGGSLIVEDTRSLSIGAGHNGAGCPMTGYVDSPRIIRGKALYTANYTGV